ncbi:MAG: hypothetical protein HW397_504 [Dehalococcoidia bacterium]|nr:hypothetical protein [Dehalococcoidia bacterium]
MPKVIPVPDAQSKPFWDAVNQKKLMVQKCENGHLGYPPKAKCFDCGSEKLQWVEVKGRGHIVANIVIEDGRLDRRKPDQPYNMALISLDEDPKINFYANLPGTPNYKVPVGAPVEILFEEVAPGQLIHDWRVVK